MSKLPNAPLIEVIYELRWIVKQSDLTKIQYLHGDLYSILKEKYSFREALLPAEFPIGLISLPSHRFRKGNKGYPLFQVGPGVITLNTIDDIYEWEDYFSKCKELTESFFSVYQADKEEIFSPNLIYLDFFKFDVSKDNVLDFVNNNLNVTIKQDFYKTNLFPKSLNLGFNYSIDLGNLNLTLKVGKNGKSEEGIIMETKLDGPKFENKKEEIFKWLNNAHEFSSNLFKKMTEGQLYNSFK